MDERRPWRRKRTKRCGETSSGVGDDSGSGVEGVGRDRWRLRKSFLVIIVLSLYYSFALLSNSLPFFCQKIGRCGSIAEAVMSSGASIRCSGKSEGDAAVEKTAEKVVGATRQYRGDL